MKRMILLAVIGCLTVDGWAYAQQKELLNHADDMRLQPMMDNPCSGSGSSPGGG